MNLLWSVSRIFFPLQIPPQLTSCSYNKARNNPRILVKSSSAAPLHPAARDRVIDFGKHRGKMLGTLPSTYLKWVSKNLRAREFEEWARLADQVLEDPVYKDRIEWEFAQNILNGDVLRSSSSSSSSTPVAELAEISERFGWDYEDKVGWAKVDFGHLGTSKGGRLPRLSGSSDTGLDPSVQTWKTDTTSRVSFSKPRPDDMGSDLVLQTSKASTTNRLSSSGPRPVKHVGEKRRERVQRMKLKRRNGNLEEDRESEVVVLKTSNGGGNVDKEESARTNIDKSSFPGREALLKKLVKTRGQ